MKLFENLLFSDDDLTYRGAKQWAEKMIEDGIFKTGNKQLGSLEMDQSEEQVG